MAEFAQYLLPVHDNQSRRCQSRPCPDAARGLGTSGQDGGTERHRSVGVRPSGADGSPLCRECGRGMTFGFVAGIQRCQLVSDS